MRKYSWEAARRDLLAGATVAAISLPQAMAYALIAGVDPRFGLYSAIVITLVASIFGSSRHLINGPTNAISLVVFSALAFIDQTDRFSVYQALFLLAIMIGVVQILIAVFRLGDLTRYISESVVIGFMAGAGFLIALGQVANFMGIKDRGDGHQHVLLRFWMTLTQAGAPNWYSFGIGAGTVVLVILLRMAARRYRLPQIDMLVALLIAAGVAARFGWSIPNAAGKTLISVVGNVPASLPTLHLPQIQLSWVRQMAGSSLAIAFLGLVEALAIAKSIAADTRQKLDYNRQCMAEGIANLVGGFFQCLPGSGSLTRSAINFQAGAVTRWSGVFAAGGVAIVVASLAPYARFIPKSALAGLLMVTAWRLIDWSRLRYTVRSSRFDGGLVLVTAFAAIFISVEFSIFIGVAISILLFVPRAARLRATELIVTAEGIVRERRPDDAPCESIVISDLEGELFFGAAPELERHLEKLRDRVEKEGLKVVILRVKRTRNPDVVFLNHLEHFVRDMMKQHIAVLLCGVRTELEQAMRNVHFETWMPPGSVFHQGATTYSSTLKAVLYAYELLDSANSCPHCEMAGPDRREELSYLS
jgi:SulP family sulfate permease